MAGNRAYIVLARNDLDSAKLQITDLSPNTSQRNPSLDGEGQTGYLTHFRQNDTTTISSTVTTSDCYGLIAYLLDNVQDDDNAGIALTVARATTAATAILTRVQNGLSLTEADIDAAIQAGTGGGTSTLTAAGLGSVEDILKILSGESYILPTASDLEDAGAFITTRRGYFTTAPNVLKPELVRSPYGFVRARNPFSGKTILTSTPEQEGTEDVNHREIRPLVDGGSLALSVLSGQLSKLVSTSFTHLNNTFSYGSGGTALKCDGTTVVPSTGVARAVTVYDRNGNVI